MAESEREMTPNPIVAAAAPRSGADDDVPVDDPAPPKPLLPSAWYAEPMNPETSIARLGWEALMAVTVVYTVIYTVYEFVFLGPENIELATGCE